MAEEIEGPRRWIDKVGELACDGLVWLLVMMMSALPWLVGLCFLLAAVNFILGGAEALLRLGQAARNWIF